MHTLIPVMTTLPSLLQTLLHTCLILLPEGNWLGRLPARVPFASGRGSEVDAEVVEKTNAFGLHGSAPSAAAAGENRSAEIWPPSPLNSNQACLYTLQGWARGKLTP